MKDKYESFIFYETFDKDLQGLDDGDLLFWLVAIKDYGLYRKEPQHLSGYKKRFWEQFKRVLDDNNEQREIIREKRRIAGRKGGLISRANQANEANQANAKNASKSSKRSKSSYNGNGNGNGNGSIITHNNITSNIITRNNTTEEKCEDEVPPYVQKGNYDEASTRDDYANTENMLTQAVMTAFAISPQQWPAIIANVYEQWTQLNATHNTRSDFDMHLRRTLAIWSNNGKLRMLLDSGATKNNNNRFDEYGGEI